MIRWIAAVAAGLMLASCGGGGGSPGACPFGSPTSCIKSQTNSPPANALPIAVAGAVQPVEAGIAVTLDGSASSDADGDTLTYAWTLTSRPTGSTAALAGATSARPTFTADIAGTYVATLVVNDGKVSSTLANVTVTATASSFSAGKTYNVSATRIGSNFYSIAGSNIIIQTKFCFEFVTSTNAVLVMTGFAGSFDGKITFASGTSCDVAGAYEPQLLSANSYSATLSYEDQSFYSDPLRTSIIRASNSCFVIRYFDSATLNLTYAGGIAYLSGFNIGTIVFADRSTCGLIGIYRLTKLN